MKHFCYTQNVDVMQTSLYMAWCCVWINCIWSHRINVYIRWRWL